MADILILANSIKNNGYCVAGIEVNSKKWIRIVGDQDGAELYLDQLNYIDLEGNMKKNPFEPFNKIIRLDLGKAVPLRYQPENKLIGQKTWQEIQLAQNNINFDTPIDLWGEGDRIKATDIEQGLINISQSLYLIQVKDLNFYVNNFNSNRAYFRYGQKIYDLAAKMDPSIFQDILNKKRKYSNILTVSLAGPYYNKHSKQKEHYKLVVAVF